MRRLLAALRTEARLYLREWLCLASLLAAVLALAGLLLAPTDMRVAWLPAALFLYALVCGFGFCGYRLLRERREGMLEALDATPLRPLEYLVAKAAAASVPAVLGASAIALACRGSGFRPLPLVLGAGSAAGLSALAGFLAASGRGKTASSVAPLAAACLLALAAPLLPVLGGALSQPAALSRWFFWHPLQGPLGLLGAAFTPDRWPALELGVSLLWAGAALVLCKRSLGRLRERGG